ncbi:MAG: hypothetical protein BGO09_07970 [Bacteroidetes bacterium 47-18]|nr:MAG: hypothetical protein BGO09_07970 [Bacteroidetes bacterium 47-18]
MKNTKIKLLNLNVFIIVLMLLTSCATSMTPVKVNNILPTLTKSRFISQADAENAVRANKCKYITKGRNYTAPIGLTTKNDLKNGAKGIDEWVELDGGNSYVLRSYKWVTVDHNGSTQLHIEFDTILCE